LVVITTPVCSYSLGQQVKQQCPSGLTEGQIAQLVKNHQVQPQQRLCNPARFAVALFFLQRINQIDRRVETHPFAFRGNTGHPNGRGQVRLALPGPLTSTVFCAVSVDAHEG
jgi:hypothetical protein